MKYVVAVVAVAALLSIVNAQTACSGVNMTMNPGVQPNFGTTLNQRCPYGYIPDPYQKRCLTYRQMVNNFLYTPCHTDKDCGSDYALYTTVQSTSAQILACGRDKTCTWYNTRAQNDSCTDNLNCISYPSSSGSSVVHGCDVNTKKCRVQTTISVGVGARCNYTVGADYYACDGTSTCVYVPTKSSVYGAGNCVALLKQGELCNTNADNLWCGAGLVCSSTYTTGAVNRTCIPLRKIGETCQFGGTTSECDQSTPSFCNPKTNPATCTAYQTVGNNCTSEYFATSFLGDTCAAPLRCLNNDQTYKKCWAAANTNETCSATFSSSLLNCATGLKCVNYMGGRCFAGNLNDPCNLSGQNTASYVDTCKWEPEGLYYCDKNRNFTCQARVPIGGACEFLQQCTSGLQCYNQTCTPYQQLGQQCNALNTDPLKALNCAPGLLCSRGVCINNYTVGVDGLCTQDLDCDTSYCDPVIRRCTRRRLCTSDASDGSCTCVCSSGYQNPGQCIMNNCGKQQRALLKCLNPLVFDQYATNASYITSVPAAFAALDSNSAFYQKCQGEHQEWVRCQGIMNKWGAPTMGLGDLINYDLATVSASSSVSLSIMVVVAFIMSAFMYL